MDSICAVVRCCSGSTAAPIGGVCGTAFFIGRDKLMTADHVVQDLFAPQLGYTQVSAWLLSRGGIRRRITVENIQRYPLKDCAMIHLDDAVENIVPLKFAPSHVHPMPGMPVMFYGYKGADPAGITFDMADGTLTPHGSPLSKHDFATAITDVTRANVSSADVNLCGQPVIVLRCAGYRGNSGGPLLAASTNEIIGLMSIGLPEDVETKDTLIAIDRCTLLPHC